jgi:fermentation-respiration switch protein FrsA (DUF1100 family)
MDVSIFDYDKKARLDINDANKPQEKDNVVVRDINFPSPKGGNIVAYLVAPKNNGLYPGIFFTHWLEPDAENSNRTQFLETAIRLGQKGVISILIDAFWSTTPKTFTKLWWNTEYEHDRDLCINQVVEILRAFDVLFSQSNLDLNRIAYVGHDFGAMFGALIPLLKLPVHYWVLIAGTSSFSDWFKFQSDPEKKLDPEYFQNYVKQMAHLDPAKHIKEASPAKVLFQFGKNDFYVPEEKALEFYSGAKEPKEIRWYDADHSMIKESFNEMETWLIKSLKL